MTDLRQLPEFEDDGLPTPEVGRWALEKYRRVWYYDQLFSTGMKEKWDQLIYIDLYAGAGYARIRDTGQIVPGSPLLALLVADRFTRYIFCEQDAKLMAALKSRVRRVAPDADLQFVAGDLNQKVDEVLEKIPPFGPGNTLLGFCFVDPFSVDLDFLTIRRLGQTLNMDFLMLLALGMDANRNLALYLDEKHERIERFLGDPDWREKWRGYRFWKEVLHYTDDQLGLGL